MCESFCSVYMVWSFLLPVIYQWWFHPFLASTSEPESKVFFYFIPVTNYSHSFPCHSFLVSFSSLFAPELQWAPWSFFLHPRRMCSLSYLDFSPLAAVLTSTAVSLPAIRPHLGASVGAPRWSPNSLPCTTFLGLFSLPSCNVLAASLPPTCHLYFSPLLCQELHLGISALPLSLPILLLRLHSILVSPYEFSLDLPILWGLHAVLQSLFQSMGQHGQVGQGFLHQKKRKARRKTYLRMRVIYFIWNQLSVTQWQVIHIELFPEPLERWARNWQKRLRLGKLIWGSPAELAGLYKWVWELTTELRAAPRPRV